MWKVATKTQGSNPCQRYRGEERAGKRGRCKHSLSAASNTPHVSCAAHHDCEHVPSIHSALILLGVSRHPKFPCTRPFEHSVSPLHKHALASTCHKTTPAMQMHPYWHGPFIAPSWMPECLELACGISVSVRGLNSSSELSTTLPATD
eukprot:358829-Chlamydomonas_euryale.AAC.14